MTRHSYILAGGLLLAALGGCKKDNTGQHDSGAPMTISDFTPAVGGGSTSVLITGSNFTSDTSQLHVTINGKRCAIVGANNNQIMVVVPKKCGSGNLVVKVGSDSIASTTPFTYIFTRTVTTFAGNGKAAFADGKGTDASFNFNGQAWYRSMGIVVDNNLNVYVADPGNACIRKIDSSGNVTVLAGSPGNGGYADGKGTNAKFSLPYDLDIDAAGNIYSVDPGNYDIRKITPDGTATTIGWGKQSPWSIAVDKNSGTVYYSSCSSPGSIFQLTATGTTEIVNGLNYPAGLAIDKSGNLYSALNGDHIVMRFAAGNWSASTLAGQKGSSGYVNGAATVARFAFPWGIDVDAAGNLYVAGNGTWDGGAYNPDQSIRFILAKTWDVSTYAGSGSSGYSDAIGDAAAFAAPTGVAVDKNGVVYVLDKNNNRIRKIVSE
ncbi:IPT/TIG domain-containing protein [Chitinophaga vietnamensis]|uniref:IPT/TIG domain-containing protein n=1 Tax=Chitinophaga vietnamensis TaxID=2593957 RepID=UPI001178316B|nr:IPT/TIG domain-containing protein [Chitinophaga vietnamensis]